MSEFYALRKTGCDEVAQDVFTSLQLASDHYETERKAVLKLQSFYRGSCVRQRWHKIQDSSRCVQRYGRGMLGRMKAMSKLLERAQKVNMTYFNHCATTIQKVFRGHWCRQYTHSMATRKEYLDRIADISDRTTTYLDQYSADQSQKAFDKDESTKKETFGKLAGQLHHLVSTHAQPGVYNPPYSEAVPTAFNIPIEQHLRLQSTARLPRSLRRPNLQQQQNATQSSYPDFVHHGELGKTSADKIRGGPPQPLARRKPLLTVTANTGRQQEIQGPFKHKDQIDLANAKAYNNYRSLQASSNYAIMEDERRLQERLSKLVRVSPDEFTVKRPPVEAAKPSVNANTRYCKPVEFRSDYTEFPKIKDKPPFYTAYKRDKDLQDYNDAPFLSHVPP